MTKEDFWFQQELNESPKYKDMYETRVLIPSEGAPEALRHDALATARRQRSGAPSDIKTPFILANRTQAIAFGYAQTTEGGDVVHSGFEAEQGTTLVLQVFTRQFDF